MGLLHRSIRSPQRRPPQVQRSAPRPGVPVVPQSIGGTATEWRLPVPWPLGRSVPGVACEGAGPAAVPVAPRWGRSKCGAWSQSAQTVGSCTTTVLWRVSGWRDPITEPGPGPCAQDAASPRRPQACRLISSPGWWWAAPRPLCAPVRAPTVTVIAATTVGLGESLCVCRTAKIARLIAPHSCASAGLSYPPLTLLAG
jgi:hypothetical protein